MSKQLSKAAATLGRKGGKIGGKIGGKARTPAKLEAAKRNGRKGGRPRKASVPKIEVTYTKLLNGIVQADWKVTYRGKQLGYGTCYGKTTDAALNKATEETDKLIALISKQ